MAKRVVVRAPDDALADRHFIAFMGVPAEKLAAAAAALDKHLAQFRQADGLCRFELNIQLFTARNPG